MQTPFHSNYERPIRHSLTPDLAAEYIEGVDIVLEAVMNEPEKVAILGAFLAQPGEPMSYTEVTSAYVQCLAGQWIGSAYRDKQEAVEHRVDRLRAADIVTPVKVAGVKKHVLSELGKAYATPVFAALVTWQLQNQHLPIHTITGTTNKPGPRGQLANGLLRVAVLEHILQDEAASQASISRALGHPRLRIKSALEGMQDHGLLDIRLAARDNQKYVRIEPGIDKVSTTSFSEERRVATEVGRRLLGKTITPISVDNFVAQVVAEYPDTDKDRLRRAVDRNLTAGVWQGLSFINSENYVSSIITVAPEYVQGIRQFVSSVVTLRQADPNVIDTLEDQTLDIVENHATHSAFARYAFEQAAIAKYSDHEWKAIIQTHAEENDSFITLHKKLAARGYPIGRKKLQQVLEASGT